MYIIAKHFKNYLEKKGREYLFFEECNSAHDLNAKATINNVHYNLCPIQFLKCLAIIYIVCKI
jgi:hypothetical protein